MEHFASPGQKRWNEMNINEKLFKIYEEANEKVFKIITERNSKEIDKATYPFFLKIPKAFEISKNKIIVYGQETYGWSDVNNDTSNTYNMSENRTDGIIECYERKFNKKEYLTYSSHFWQVFKLLNDYFCECSKEFGYLWNNIEKMGLDGDGFPDNWYDDIIKPYFNDLVNKEIEIIKPDFLVFFTGTTRDHVLDDIFNKPERKNVENYDQKDLCEIILPDIKKAFRTHHPRYLCKVFPNGQHKEILKLIHKEIYKIME
jgi:hypothetical protein